MAVPGVVAPIVGPRTFEQMEDLLGAADLSLTEDERARLAAHAPPPEMYPQRMLHEQVASASSRSCADDTVGRSISPRRSRRSTSPTAR